MTGQLMFPSGPADPDTRALLELIAGDPIHEDDRAAVVGAIVAAARANGGRVDPNEVRKRLDGSVYPRVVGATYQSLAAKGVLVPDGWTISQDKHGRNSGKPARKYRLRAGVNVVASRSVGDDRGTAA